MSRRFSILQIYFLLRNLVNKYCVIIRPLQHLGWALAVCPESGGWDNQQHDYILCGPLAHEMAEVFIASISQRQLWNTHCVQSTENSRKHQSEEKAQFLLLKSFKFNQTVKIIQMKMFKNNNNWKTQPIHYIHTRTSNHQFYEIAVSDWFQRLCDLT